MTTGAGGAPAPSSTPPLLQVRNLSKRFDMTQAR